MILSLYVLKFLRTEFTIQSLIRHRVHLLSFYLVSKADSCAFCLFYHLALWIDHFKFSCHVSKWNSLLYFHLSWQSYIHSPHLLLLLRQRNQVLYKALCHKDTDFPLCVCPGTATLTSEPSFSLILSAISYETDGYLLFARFCLYSFY